MWVVRRLREAGHEALFAGGCVRDMLLRRRCSDYDVATDATPQQVKRLFPRVLLIGAKFGVAVVLRGGRKVEVATFRSDVSYSDGRRPDAVRFSSPREDALRRDFTINGMFFDPIGRKVIDYVGGRRDLDRGVVRTIGTPDDRFGEDYLRMLRAMRFAVRLGFRIEPATAAAVREHAAKITGISGERVYDELYTMLAAGSAGEALRRLDELGLARHVLGELFVPDLLWPAAVARVGKVASRKDLTLTFGALLGELSGGAIGTLTRRWGASNELRDAVRWLSSHLGEWGRVAEMSLAGFRRLAGHEQFGRLRVLWRVEEQRATGGRKSVAAVTRQSKAIPPGEPALPAPLVTGLDLLTMGVPEGPRLGRLLRAAYDAQLNRTLRTRAAALAWVRRHMDDSHE